MKYICLICILFHNSVYAQLNPGPRSVSMGSAGAALQDVWSLQQNPAGIAGIERPIFAIGYEQHFLDQELSTQSAVFALPFKQNVFGLSFQRYGFSEFLEQTAGFAYARSFGSSLAISIAFKFHQVQILKYGSAHAFSVEAGMQYRLSERIWIGSHISNPGRSQFEELSGSNIPVSMSLGIAGKFSDKVLIISDIQKVLYSGLDVKLGLEYKLIKWFSMRGGVSANPFKQYAGFGLNYHRFAIDAAISSHPSLGLSPNMALNYEF